MKLIDWFVRNPVAANLVMVAIVVAGVVAMSEMNRERFPAFSIDRISISAVYESASPEGEDPFSPFGGGVMLRRALLPP